MTTTVSTSANSVVIVKAFDFGKIKTAFKMGKSVYAKIQKAQEKMAKLQSEIEAQQVLLNGINAYTELITKGYTPQDLVTEIVEPTEKLDKNGNTIMSYRYEPKEGVVKFNEEKKYYEILPTITDENPVEGVDIDDTPNAETEIALGTGVAEEGDVPETWHDDNENAIEAGVEPAQEGEAPADAFGEAKNFEKAEDVNWDNL